MVETRNCKTKLIIMNHYKTPLRPVGRSVHTVVYLILYRSIVTQLAVTARGVRKWTKDTEVSLWDGL